MKARVGVVGLFALALSVALAPAASAEGGLYLKLSSDAARVDADQPVKVKVVAVGMRTLSLPATPVFLVDDGSGARAVDAVRALDSDGPVEVTPEKSHTGGYELTLPKAGRYKIQAEYRVGRSPVRSNKVTVDVGAAADTRAGQ